MIGVIRTERRRPDGTITPPRPEDVAWMDRVNQKARFRFQPRDEMLGAAGEPFLRLPLAAEDEDGYPFHELALYLYNRHVGALLCHPDKVVGPDSDHFPLSYGDVVDYVQTGQLMDRIPLTPPWGYPDGFLADESNPTGTTAPDFSKLPRELQEPDLFILPKTLRQNIQWLFTQVAAEAVGVSLLHSANGTQMLLVLYRLPDQQMNDVRLQQQISQRLTWYLPRHYAAVILASPRVEGYELFP